MLRMLFEKRENERLEIVECVFFNMFTTNVSTNFRSTCNELAEKQGMIFWKLSKKIFSIKKYGFIKLPSFYEEMFATVDRDGQKKYSNELPYQLSILIS